MQYIEDHPEEWDQRYWATRTDCGTAFCFAGRAVVLARPSATFQWNSNGQCWLTADSPERSIAGEAMDLLGLAYPQGRVLFDATNTLDDLRRHVKTLCDEGVVIDPDTGLAW